MSLVSIIIPTFNRAHLLPKTLQSIIGQTYAEWECLVVDDGSNDSSKELIRRMSIEDSRISWLERPIDRYKGANACRNFGLDNAKGELVIFFDSDDIMMPTLLEEQVKSMNVSKSNFSICQCNWVAKNGKLIEGFHGGKLHSNDPINDYIRFRIFWPINGVCYLRGFLTQNNLQFDEGLQQSQEYDFHVRVLKVDTNFAIIEKKLLQIVTTEDSISHAPSNTYAKAKSSLKVRHRFLSDKSLHLELITKIFLLHDMHRIFKQQTLDRNVKASFLAGFYYLRGHFYSGKLFWNYFFRHWVFVTLVFIGYNFFSKGYSLLKKSNTFGYTRNS
ncbi:MAG: glycosyltransferase family 2 protein [Flavobacteriaceae bacterium]|nr:glycosyltransferase family 2 protein [Flavobacteriaceae bacterium]